MLRKSSYNEIASFNLNLSYPSLAMERLPSNIADCYQILGLPQHASIEEVKSAYRKLVKRYHPDYNPGDRRASEQFIRVRRAYETLMAAIEQFPPSSDSRPQPAAAPPPRGKVKIYVKHRHSPTEAPAAKLTPEQEQVKQQWLDQVYMLLKRLRWQQAARQAEELARQFPRDPDIGKALAKAYLGWARELLDHRRYDAARPYLQKAMKADSNNQELWEEIERDYIRIERGLRL